jgi:hypothetical protein
MVVTSRGNDLSQVRTDGSIANRDHAKYDKCHRIWNSLADQRPAAVLRARDVDDVRKTVRIAAKQNALLAIRCGGLRLRNRMH